MNYQDFLFYRSVKLATDPQLKDMGETNLYDFLPKKFDFLDFSVPPAVDTAYRCHLVDHMWKFLDNENGVTQNGIYPLASKGVRNSLDLLFRYLNNKNITITIPSSIYPVYEQLAIKNNLNIKYYDNSNSYPFEIDRLLKEPIENNWLLICEDKFQGADIDRGLGYRALTKWLNSNKNNKVIIDGVYLYGMSTKIAELVRKGKIIYLTSLAKAFLLPNTFGVAYVDKTLHTELFDMFRNEQKDQAKMQIALSALTTHLHVNKKVKLCISSLGVPTTDPRRIGKIYLIRQYSDIDTWEKVHKTLVIPLSVFGHPNNYGTVLSYLK